LQRWSEERHVQDGDPDPDDVVEQKRAQLKIWKDAEVMFPRPFSILPVQRLQRRLMDYDSTTLSAFLCEWVPKQLSIITSSHPPSRAGALEEGRYQFTEVEPSVELLTALFQEGRNLKKKRASARNADPETAEADQALNEMHEQRQREAGGRRTPSDGSSDWLTFRARSAPSGFRCASRPTE
jgi:hypothetical protein